jgi:uncharacterized membrane protein YbhN (UPF0104 family)
VTLEPLLVHLACLALVAVDFVARTWRTQLFLRGLGHPLSFREVFVQSAIGETASSLTPLRAGGEPARIWAMTVQGVPNRIAIVAIGVEFVAVAVLIIAVAIALGVTVAPDWWAATGPAVIGAATRHWPWLVGVVLVTALAWVLLGWMRPDLLHATRAELAAARGHLGEIPLRVYLLCVPVTLLNIGARVAILPLLASTLDQPPPLAATIVGSFALLYAQAVIPTPAGAGAVELGFLGGAVGNLGPDDGALLAWWRVYTTIIGTGLGIVLAVWRFHANVVAFALKRPESEKSSGPGARDERES